MKSSFFNRVMIDELVFVAGLELRPSVSTACTKRGSRFLLPGVDGQDGQVSLTEKSASSFTSWNKVKLSGFFPRISYLSVLTPFGRRGSTSDADPS